MLVYVIIYAFTYIMYKLPWFLAFKSSSVISPKTESGYEMELENLTKVLPEVDFPFHEYPMRLEEK